MKIEDYDRAIALGQCYFTDLHKLLQVAKAAKVLDDQIRKLVGQQNFSDEEAEETSRLSELMGEALGELK